MQSIVHDVSESLSTYDEDNLGKTLNQKGVTLLSHLLNERALKSLSEEADRLLSKALSIRTNVASTGNTPRNYRSVGSADVLANGGPISELYMSPILPKFLSRLTRQRAVTCPYEPERIVVNQMMSPEETHGWHWDDYTYSVVLCLEAPRPDNGGQVEYLDGTEWDKQNPQVDKYLAERTPQSLTLESGDAYVLLGRRVMHRVTPLKTRDNRKIICYTYALDSESGSIEHGSMEDIYNTI